MDGSNDAQISTGNWLQIQSNFQSDTRKHRMDEFNATCKTDFNHRAISGIFSLRAPAHFLTAKRNCVFIWKRLPNETHPCDEWTFDEP